MECKKCSAVNPEEAVFCRNCGKRLDGKVSCPARRHERRGFELLYPLRNKALEQIDLPLLQHRLRGELLPRLRKNGSRAAADKGAQSKTNSHPSRGVRNLQMA